MTRDDNGADSVVDRVYEQLKAMSVSFELKPGERLNEGKLAKRLGVSRTPLREALNRLNTEGFLGKGFFCRELDAHEPSISTSCANRSRRPRCGSRSSAPRTRT
jgi:DNA-binding GntR family transcriptional regulator